MARKGFSIILAETAGFCMGVRRAVKMVLDAADAPDRPMPIRTWGPLIHNQQVLRVLESRGIRSTAHVDGPGSGTAVIRAHGLSREEQERLRARSEALLDATCPHVRRVQQIVAQYAGQGYMCVVVGDAGHAEVDGVLSYAAGRGRVVSGPEEVAGLPAAEKVAVVAQTTQDEEVFRRTVDRVRERFGECLAFDTICRSTERRQTEVRELAGKVDAMIVVGGLDSANTRRLAEVSAAAGTPTFHVESERALDLDRILSYEKVGLTAGASTPNWMIRKVVRRLEDEHRRRTRPASYAARLVLRGLVNANLYAAGGAAALTFACSRLLERPPDSVAPCMAVSFFFVLSQHLLNQYGRRELLYLGDPDRADFFLANERALLMLGVCSWALAVFLAFFLGWWAFGVVVLGSVAGLMYRFSLPRKLSRWVGFRSLEHLPGSKELFVGLGWGTLAGVVPSLAAERPAHDLVGAAGAFAVAFLMAVERTLALDLRDVETDRIVGRETLASVLGPATGRTLFFVLSALAGALLAGAGVLGIWATAFWVPMLLSVPCAWGCLALMRRQGGRLEGEMAEAMMDGQFYLVGLAALGWGLLTAAGHVPAK
jgi:(E)-4-hydroxy-3-methyl-but-2-enyl pyrophosphate reductase